VEAGIATHQQVLQYIIDGLQQDFRAITIVNAIVNDAVTIVMLLQFNFDTIGYP